MAVDRSNLDLSRFRYTAPAWWEGFNAGRRAGREQAISERADWQPRDWHRGAVAKIKEGAEA